tara:strand:+ start:3728 stop:3982 length:255 start_codon:yes stop_codon:yes gene_type:complete
MRIIALVESAVGNWTVKSPLEDDLSDPKSNTAIAGLVPPLAKYTNAPRAVNVAELHTESEKSRKAVVPEDAGLADMVSVLPPAV